MVYPDTTGFVSEIFSFNTDTVDVVSSTGANPLKLVMPMPKFWLWRN